MSDTTRGGRSAAKGAKGVRRVSWELVIVAVGVILLALAILLRVMEAY